MATRHPGGWTYLLIKIFMCCSVSVHMGLFQTGPIQVRIITRSSLQAAGELSNAQFPLWPFCERGLQQIMIAVFNQTCPRLWTLQLRIRLTWLPLGVSLSGAVNTVSFILTFREFGNRYSARNSFRDESLDEKRKAQVENLKTSGTFLSKKPKICSLWARCTFC